VTTDPAYVSDANPTRAYTDEPTDITRDPTTGHFFVSSDGPDRTFEVDPGADGTMGGGDDVVVGELRHRLHGFSPFPALDVEGIAYGDGALWLAVGNDVPPTNRKAQTAEIYEVLPGPDGRFTGSGAQRDNVVTHWDTAGIGQTHPEGVAYDPATGHLFIVSGTRNSDISEVTTDGTLVGVIEGSDLGIRKPSGLTFASASDGAGGKSLYVTDRGVDNDTDPAENDGKIYELVVGERPPAPTGLVAVSATRGIRLDWDDSVVPLGTYNVYRSLPQVGGYEKLTASPRRTSRFVDPAAPTGTDLIYQVTMVDTTGIESDPSEIGVRRGVIALRGRSAADNGAEGGTSLRIRRPSAAQDGDVLVAVVDVRGGASITAPAGWTLVREDANGRKLRQAVYHHVAVPGKTRYVFRFGSARAATGVIAAYSGVASVSTLSSGSANASSRRILAPSVAMGTTLDEGVLIGAFGTAGAGGITPPASMIERAEAVSAGTGEVSTELSDQVLFSFTETGSRTALAPKAVLSIGQLVLLLP
jgi:hypothetical protein